MSLILKEPDLQHPDEENAQKEQGKGKVSSWGKPSSLQTSSKPLSATQAAIPDDGRGKK